MGYYQPMGSSFCLPCPSFCPDCSNNLQCLSCPYGFYLSNGNCIACSTPNCASCSIMSSNLCTLCNVGYYLTSNNTCGNCIGNCAVCSDGQSCLACNNGFYLNSNQNGCLACPAHCGICTTNTSCNQCYDGYYPKLGVCYPCSSSCIECNTLNQCTQCASGYYLEFANGIPTGDCLACSYPCRTCTENSTICTSCQTGYYLSERTETCESCTSGCLVCNDVLGCIICNVGYLKLRNSSQTDEVYYCLGCPRNCVNCTAQSNNGVIQTVCSQCIPGYQELTTGQCFACGSTAATLGCKVCNVTMGCSVCQDGLVLN